MIWGRIGKGAQGKKNYGVRGIGFYAPMAKSCSMSLLNGAIFTACPSFFSGLWMLKGRWGKGGRSLGEAVNIARHALSIPGA